MSNNRGLINVLIYLYMKSRIFIIALVFFLLGGVGYSVSADHIPGHIGVSDPNPCPDIGPGSENCDPNNNTGSGGSESIKLNNPLGTNGIDNIPDLVKAILEIALKIGVPLIALAIIYAGFKFIAAQGNSEELKKAKDTLIYVIVGAAILLAAYAIATAIVNTVSSVTG